MCRVMKFTTARPPRMFEDPRVLQALFGAAVPTLDSVFDGLADYIGEHFAPGFLQSLIDAG